MINLFCSQCEKMAAGSVDERQRYREVYGSLSRRPFLGNTVPGGVVVSVSKGRGRHKSAFIREGELQCICGHITKIKGGVVDE